MERKDLITAILSGKREELKQVLPVVNILSHTELAKAVNYLCEHDMPPGSAYNWCPRLTQTDLPAVLTAFDTAYTNLHHKRRMFDGIDEGLKELFFRVHDFIDHYYNRFIEPDRFDFEFNPNRRKKLLYKPYYEKE
jgi:hypothetical protein